MVVYLQKKSIPFKKSEVLRYLGYRKAKNFLDKKTEAVIDIESENAFKMITPAGIHKVYSKEKFPIKLNAKSIIKHLKNSEGLILFTVTIGSKIDDVISKKFNSGHYTEGIVLDAVATELVEACADLYTEILKKKFTGYSFTARFSPGYGDWHLNVQPEIIKELGAGRIGVRVSDAMFLIPRKTITAVIGLSKNKISSRNPDCSSCSFNGCSYRKRAEEI